MSVPSLTPGSWMVSPSRLEAFSDGVFAIAVTLLVLELHAPEMTDRGAFAEVLTKEWPTYVAYVAAFVMIGSVWLHHHVVLSMVSRVDLPFVLVNLPLLFVASVFPFPTSVLSSAWRIGSHQDQVVATVLFALTSVAASLAYAGVCTSLTRQPGMEVSGAGRAFLRAERKRSLVAIAGVAVAVVVGVVFTPTAALILLAATPAFYLGTLPRTLAMAPAQSSGASGA